jgi:two-component system chemotaxis sensor kinase CheA
MNNDEVLRQVWPVFSAEAREILQNIGRRVLSLEEGDASAETHEAVQRDAHSLKGMSGSLGLEDVVVLAHAVEDRLVASREAPALPHAAAEAILRALDAIEAALDASPAPGVVRVEALPERLAQLRACADPGTGGPDAPAEPAPEPASVVEAAAPAKPSPAPPAAGSPPPAPSPSGPPARPAGPAPARDEGAIRVPARILDQIGGAVEALSLVADATERRAQALVAVGEALQTAVVAARGAALDDPDALFPVLDRMLELAREVARHGLESQRDALRHKLETAAAREDLRQLRMVPISLALEPLRRAARDAASALGKEVALHLEGGELRLDRRIVEAVKDPLVHLVRNAVDHGLEAAEARAAAGKGPAGRIDVRVAPRGHRVAIQVTDDGAGLSAERIRRRAVERDLLPAEEAARLPDAEVFRLAFTPGFSTADRVTEISGRGVGLDVVQSAVTRLQGTVQVASTPGRGTTFELDLPLALSVTLGVLVRVEAARAAIPAEAVERVLRVRPEELGEIQGRIVATVGGKQLPFEELAEVLHLQDHPPPRDGAPRPALLLRMGDARLVLGIDEVLGERELVVRGLGRRGAGAPLLAGAALLEDGAIISVLNPAMLLGRSQPRSAPRPAGVARIVVADDSLTSRTAVKTILEVAGYTVIAAVDGEDAWRHIRMGGVDLVVTDCQMPRLDGLGLARRLKGDPALRATPLILVTSLDAPEDRRAGLEAGADAYVVKKDVQGGALLDLVRALLPARR